MLAVATGAIAWAAAWLWIGFADVHRYAGLVRHAEISEGPNGYGLFWRLSESSTTYLVVAAASAVVVAWVSHRRPDATGFAVAMLAALVATPQLWLDYFALLVAVVGVFRRRLAFVWLAPLILWVTPHQEADRSLWRIGVVFALVAATAVWVLLRDPSREDDETLQRRVRRVAGRQHELLEADIA